MRRYPLLTLPLAAVLACAETTAPLPPPQELLLVVNSGEPSLSLIRIRPEGSPLRLQIPVSGATPSRVATRGTIALVPLGATDGLAVFDLAQPRLERVIPLATGSAPFDAVLIGDSVAYVSNPPLNTITRIDLRTNDTASVLVGRWPTGILAARGRLFVLNANLALCDAPVSGTCSAGESWITVVDPFTNSRSTGRDSIPLPGPGNAISGTVGGDGFLYILNAGATLDGEIPDGRLSIVDPIRRSELGSFGGFGQLPAWVTSDGGERVFIGSPSEGLMEFNARTRSVVRGVGQGLPVVDNAAVVVDRSGLVYAIESGSCAGGGAPGRVRIYRANLTEVRVIALGTCATGSALALVPVEGGELPPAFP